MVYREPYSDLRVCWWLQETLGKLTFVVLQKFLLQESSVSTRLYCHTEPEDGALSVQHPQQSYILYITPRKIRHAWPGEEFCSTCTDYKCARAILAWYV